MTLILIALLGQCYQKPTYYYPSYYPTTYYQQPTYVTKVQVLETPVQLIKVGETVREETHRTEITQLTQQVNALIAEKQQAAAQVAANKVQQQEQQMGQMAQSIQYLLNQKQQIPVQEYMPQKTQEYPQTEQATMPQDSLMHQESQNPLMQIYAKYNCKECHTQGKEKGNFVIFDSREIPLILDFKDQKKIYFAMKTGRMPYKSKTKVSLFDLNTFKDSILEGE